MIMTTQISALGPSQNEKPESGARKMQMSDVKTSTWSIATQGHLQILHPGDQKRAIAFATIFGSKLTEKSQMRAMTRQPRPSWAVLFGYFVLEKGAWCLYATVRLLDLACQLLMLLAHGM